MNIRAEVTMGENKDSAQEEESPITCGITTGSNTNNNAAILLLLSRQHKVKWDQKKNKQANLKIHREKNNISFVFCKWMQKLHRALRALLTDHQRQDTSCYLHKVKKVINIPVNQLYKWKKSLNRASPISGLFFSVWLHHKRSTSLLFFIHVDVSRPHPLWPLLSRFLLSHSHF